MQKRNYTILRKIRKGERPATSVPEYIERALSEVMKDRLQILTTFDKVGPKARARRERLLRRGESDLRRASEQRLKRRSSALYSYQPAHEGPLPSRPSIGSYELAVYETLQDYLDSHPQHGEEEYLRLPVILSIDPVWIRPGSSVAISGTDFGEGPRVHFQISENFVVELEVQECTDTFILASLNALIGDCQLRPFEGWVWIETKLKGKQKHSFSRPLRYCPWSAEYLGEWSTEISGYGGGNHADGVCFENVTLNDPDFSITTVTGAHTGDGHSELVGPYAGGQNMAQGWHIGVRGFGDAEMTIYYHLVGPANVPPPDVGIYWWLGAIF